MARRGRRAGGRAVRDRGCDRGRAVLPALRLVQPLQPAFPGLDAGLVDSGRQPGGLCAGGPWGDDQRAARHVGAGEWTAGLERMVVSEANPVDGTWLLFWDGGFYRHIPDSYPDHAWGLCGLAVAVDADGNPVGEPFQVTEWGATASSQIVPAVAFDPSSQRWLLAWSTNPHGSPRRVLGRLVEWSREAGQITANSTISIAATYRDAFAPAAAYNPAAGEFLVAFTVNGLVNSVNRSWELVYQRVLTDGMLPGGVEASVLLDRHGTHNWTDANSLEVVSGTGEYLLSYASVRDGGGFFTGPYDVRQFRLDGQGAGPSNGLVSDYTPRATDGEYDVAVGDGGSVLAVWGDLRDGAPHVWGRRYGVGDELPTPRVTKYYYHGGQRVAQRTLEGLYYLHGDHLGSTSLATYGSGAQIGQIVPDSRVWYYPYGEVRYGGEGSPTDFGFTGQRNVPGTNLIHMGARWYDPRLGRWISADTLVPDFSNPQSLNRYSYVYNRPLAFIDRGGHLPVPVIVALVVLGGVGVGYGVSTLLGYHTLPFDPPTMITNRVTDQYPITSSDMTVWLCNQLVTNAQSDVVHRIQEAWLSGNLAKQDAAMQAWTALVGTGATWDFKPDIILADKFIPGTYDIILGNRQLHYDVIANIHFGFVGRAAGFSGELLKWGAGIAQTKRAITTLDPENFGDCLGSYCDHPYATWAIGFGTSLYKDYWYRLDELTDEAFTQALQAYIEEYGEMPPCTQSWCTP
ncbi:MAG: hypothetical protein JW850_21585 [Thermoflexales bacterium]|nr:hypothetical protein [Thermoflexales bacterium]